MDELYFKRAQKTVTHFSCFVALMRPLGHHSSVVKHKNRLVATDKTVH